VDFEVQHWIAEALEGATHATELILGRVASAGKHRLSQGDKDGRKKAGDLDPAASRAAKAVMKAATADPLSDAQLDRIVKLALGRRIPAAPAAAGGEVLSQAATPAVGPTGNQPARRRVESEDGGESHASDLTGPKGSPPAMGRARSALPEPRQAAQSSSGTPAAQSSGTAPQAKAGATAQGGKKKSRAARRAARAALEAEDGSPTADGGQAPPAMKSQQCPVFGCTREHAPNDCPTFLNMAPKEAGSSPCKAAVSSLPATPLERRMRGRRQEIQLPSGRLWQTTPRDAARSSEGQEVLPAGEGHGPSGRTDSRNGQEGSRDGKAAQRPTRGPGNRSRCLGSLDRDPESRGAKAAAQWRGHESGRSRSR
jgi:hypothetical protein